MSWRDRSIKDPRLSIPGRSIDYLTKDMDPPVKYWGELADQIRAKPLFLSTLRDKIMVEIEKAEREEHDVVVASVEGTLTAIAADPPSPKPASPPPPTPASQASPATPPAIKSPATVAAVQAPAPQVAPTPPAAPIPPAAPAPTAIPTGSDRFRVEQLGLASHTPPLDARSKKVAAALKWLHREYSGRLTYVQHAKFIVVAAVKVSLPKEFDQSELWLEAEDVITATTVHIWTANDLAVWWRDAHEYAAENVCEIDEAMRATMPVCRNGWIAEGVKAEQEEADAQGETAEGSN